MTAKIFSIISIKGGVGKTTTALNIGASIAQHLKKRVLLLDANFSAPNLGLHLGIIKPEKTIHDVILKKEKIEEVIYGSEHGFHIILGDINYIQTRKNPPNWTLLEYHIKKLKPYYDYIIIDSSPSANTEFLAAINSADELLVVTTPDPPTLSCTLNVINRVKKTKRPIRGLIINKATNKKYEIDKETINQLTKMPVLAIIKHDLDFIKSIHESTPLVIMKPMHHASTTYKNLIETITETEVEKNILDKIRNLFVVRN